MRLSHPDRVILSAAAGISIAFVVAGRLNTATAVLLVPLLLRGGVVMLDVFWTSFTGTPLLRARRPRAERIARDAVAADLAAEAALSEAAQAEAGQAAAGGACSPSRPAQLGAFEKLSILPTPLRAPEPRRVAMFDNRDVRPDPPSRRLRARKARLGIF